MNKYKIKETNKYELKDTEDNVFCPRFLRYNLSFVHEDFFSLPEDIHKCFNETLKFISTQPWLVLKNQPKEVSNETIDIKQMRTPKMYSPYVRLCGSNFTDNGRKLGNKRDIFRLRGTKLGRIIGIIFDFTYYVFYVDSEGECYNHGG